MKTVLDPLEEPGNKCVHELKVYVQYKNKDGGWGKQTVMADSQRPGRTMGMCISQFCYNPFLNALSLHGKWKHTGCPFHKTSTWSGAVTGLCTRVLETTKHTEGIGWVSAGHERERQRPLLRFHRTVLCFHFPLCSEHVLEPLGF